MVGWRFMGKASIQHNVHVGLCVQRAKNHVTSKQQQWRIPLKKPSIPVRLSLIFFSVNTDHIGKGFKADTPEITSNRPIECDFRTNVWLKVIDEQPIFQ